jgi:hypothetical protein
MLGTVKIREDIKIDRVRSLSIWLAQPRQKAFVYVERNSSNETSGGQPYLMGRITVPKPRVT